MLVCGVLTCHTFPQTQDAGLSGVLTWQPDLIIFVKPEFPCQGTWAKVPMPGHLSTAAKLKNTICQQVLRAKRLLKSALGYLSPAANSL